METEKKEITGGMLACGKCYCAKYYVYEDPRVVRVWLECSQCGNISEIVRRN